MPKLAITQHEYSLDNGSTWATCTIPMDNGDDTATIPVGDIAIPTGHLIVRRIGETNPAKWLRNAAAFTIATSTPAPATDGGMAKVASNLATLSGATTPEATAASDYLVGLETDGIDDAFASLYLLIGNSAANKRYNAMDPDTGDVGSHNLIYGATPLSVPEGIQFQGTGYTKIKLALKNLPNAPIVGGGAYVDDPACQYIFYDENNDLILAPQFSGKVWASVGSGEVGVTAARPLGLFYAMRKDLSTVETFLGADLYTTHTSAFNSLSNPGTATPPATPKGELGIWEDGAWKAKLIFTLGRYLNATERTAFNDRTETFLTAIGRI